MLSQDIFSEEIKKSLLFHIPHSSNRVLSEFFENNTRPDDEVAYSTDWSTEQIFDVKDIKRLVYPFHRSICDVERFLDDPMNARGRGFNYTHDFEGKPLKKRSFVTDDLIRNFFYNPWQAMVHTQVSDIIEEQGRCYIIDCHSFNNIPDAPDICIGTDEFHTPDFLINRIRNFFVQHGFTVAINKPYNGSYVPEAYYRKSHLVKSIMIEVNKKLYTREEESDRHMPITIDKLKVQNLNKLMNELFSFS